MALHKSILKLYTLDFFFQPLVSKRTHSFTFGTYIFLLLKLNIFSPQDENRFFYHYVLQHEKRQATTKLINSLKALAAQDTVAVTEIDVYYIFLASYFYV